MTRHRRATGGGPPRLALVVGNTATAEIRGISAAGASPELARHTPAADAELLVHGDVVRAPAVPVSPTGCPTPALVTRAVRDLVGFDPLVVDAGIAAPTAAPTVDLAGAPGGDVREAESLPEAAAVFEAAHELGRQLPDDELFVGESVPGGTTTALGVLRALGEPHGVSSSLPENPLDLKGRVVAEGLSASGLDAGGAAGAPTDALRLMGDPVLAGASGLAAGAVESGTEVTLAGGTQLVAVAALLRHAGVEGPLALATTSFVADDPTVDLAGAADALDLDLTVTDPGFDGTDHQATAAFARGEAKEGVGLGGALALAESDGVPMAAVRERLATVYERACGVPPDGKSASDDGSMGVPDGGP